MFLRTSDHSQQADPLLIRMNITAQNLSGNPLPEQKIRIFIPRQNTPYQSRISVGASTQFEEVSDPNGDEWIVLNASIPPYGTHTAFVESKISAWAEPRYEDDPPTDSDYSPEFGVQSDAIEIKVKAQDLTRGDAVSTAETIFQFVRDHIPDRGYVRDDLGALTALHERRGDCTEHASLFVALARAAGLPARRVGGFVLRTSASVGAHDYHNWAEVYLEDAWRIVDPFRDVFQNSSERYISYRIIRGGSAEDRSQSFLSFDSRLRVTLQ